jgi:hypothetical protein
MNRSQTHRSRSADRAVRKLVAREKGLRAAIGLSVLLGVSSAAGFPQLANAQSDANIDYAVEAFGDPWDWSSASDGYPSRDMLSQGIETAQVANGQVNFTVDRPSFWFFLQGGYIDSTPTGKDASAFPVDASRFNRMVMRITSSQRLSAGLLWFGCTEGDSCVGGVPLDLQAGTHTYDISLGSAKLATRSWGGKISAMRLDFQPSSATQVSVDWMRLTNSAGSAAQWSGPIPEIVEPDITGGDDLAALTRNGDSWDFSQPSDLLRADNATARVEGGRILGVNALPGLNDPSVTMKLTRAFNGADFHRMTVKWGFEGPFSLRDEPGGGMNARIVWRIAGTAPTPDGQDLQEGRDVVMYPYESQFTVDLATSPASAVVDPRPGKAKIGWANQLIELVRFDPNEDPGPRPWYVDDVKLAADDAGDSFFDIQLADRQAGPGTVADVFVDSDTDGFNGTLVARGVDLSDGSATVRWTPPVGTTGTYWVHTTVTRSGASVRRYSGGPVRMGVASGSAAYQFGPAVGGPASQVGIGDDGAPTGSGATPPSLALATPPATTAPKKASPGKATAKKPAAKKPAIKKKPAVKKPPKGSKGKAKQ